MNNISITTYRKRTLNAEGHAPMDLPLAFVPVATEPRTRSLAPQDAATVIEVQLDKYMRNLFADKITFLQTKSCTSVHLHLPRLRQTLQFETTTATFFRTARFTTDAKIG